jgi:hypothetical protein
MSRSPKPGQDASDPSARPASLRVVDMHPIPYSKMNGSKFSKTIRMDQNVNEIDP